MAEQKGDNRTRLVDRPRSVHNERVSPGVLDPKVEARPTAQSRGRTRGPPRVRSGHEGWRNRPSKEAGPNTGCPLYLRPAAEKSAKYYLRRSLSYAFSDLNGLSKIQVIPRKSGYAWHTYGRDCIQAYEKADTGPYGHTTTATSERHRVSASFFFLSFLNELFAQELDYSSRPQTKQFNPARRG